MFLKYKPKNTIYLNLGTINFCGVEYTIYSDTSNGEIYFRMTSDFDKFEKLLALEQEYVEPPKAGITKGKIKLGGGWQECEWDIDKKKIQLFL